MVQQNASFSNAGKEYLVIFPWKRVCSKQLGVVGESNCAARTNEFVNVRYERANEKGNV